MLHMQLNKPDHCYFKHIDTFQYQDKQKVRFL